MKSRRWSPYLVAVVVLASLQPLASSLHGQDFKSTANTLAGSLSASGCKTVAVVDFTDLEGNVTALGRYLAEEMSVNLSARAGNFTVIERNQLRVIIQEHRLSAAGLIDPQTAKRLGEIAGADALITGTTTTFGDSVHVIAKIIDTRTAVIIGAASYDLPRTKAIDDLLQSNGDARTTVPALGDAKLAREISARQGGLEISVDNCRRSTDLVTCSGFVKNETEKRMSVNLAFQPLVAIDNLGSQYKTGLRGNWLFAAHGSGSIGFDDGGSTEELEPELPVKFSIILESVHASAKSLALIFSIYIVDQRQVKITLRDVPISTTQGSPR